MSTVTIKKENLQKAYDSADESGKQMLTALFDFEPEKLKPITERIKTFEDVCREAGKDPEDYKCYDSADDDEQHENATKKIRLIAKVLNEGWEADFSDSSQVKYWPWFKYVAGSGFACHDYASSRSATGVGARLCFRSAELAKYAGTQFIDIYNQFLTR